MTKEHSENVLVVALALSLGIHAALMIFVRPHILAQGAVADVAHAERRVPMRVTSRETPPDPVKIEEILDLKAPKDAPAAVGEKAAPLAPSPASAVPEVEAPKAAPSASQVAPEAPAAAVFDAKLEGADATAEKTPFVPVTRFETPVTAAADPMPVFARTVTGPAAAPVLSAPAVTLEPSAALLPASLGRADESEKVAFTPAEKVYERVDEKVVAEEKSAVRALVDADDAADLVKAVRVTMTAQTDGDWRYFKVTLAPTSELEIVPKDVVVLIDGSGSIGNDRLGSCRKAARQILRTATNTGDRFNLVVFRNAFSYAFRAWQDCNAESFAAADKWLSRETAHGRTDVFSTIRSVLTLPRNPTRPLVALVVTDGQANAGVSDTAQILSKFTALNDGLVSVYMYGVKSAANRELIDLLTHANRGESFVFEGWRWSAGEGMEGLSERFRDPVLSDLRVVFATGTPAEAYPRLLRNLYRGAELSFVGRVPATAKSVAFSLKGLNGENAYEGFFRLPFATAPEQRALKDEWIAEQTIARRLQQ